MLTRLTASLRLRRPPPDQVGWGVSPPTLPRSWVLRLSADPSVPPSSPLDRGDVRLGNGALERVGTLWAKSPHLLAQSPALK